MSLPLRPPVVVHKRTASGSYGQLYDNRSRFSPFLRLVLLSFAALWILGYVLFETSLFSKASLIWKKDRSGGVAVVPESESSVRGQLAADGDGGKWIVRADGSWVYETE